MTYLDKPSNWNTMTKSQKKNFYKRSSNFSNYNKSDNADNTIGWILVAIMFISVLIFISAN